MTIDKNTVRASLTGRLLQISRVSTLVAASVTASSAGLACDSRKEEKKAERKADADKKDAVQDRCPGSTTPLLVTFRSEGLVAEIVKIRGSVSFDRGSDTINTADKPGPLPLPGLQLGDVLHVTVSEPDSPDGCLFDAKIGEKNLILCNEGRCRRDGRDLKIEEAE